MHKKDWILDAANLFQCVCPNIQKNERVLELFYIQIPMNTNDITLYMDRKSGRWEQKQKQGQDAVGRQRETCTHAAGKQCEQAKSK